MDAEKMYFSYGQFMVFDRGVKLPGCSWTEAHYARRESTVCFRAFEEFGQATVGVRMAAYVPTDEYARAIAVPFEVISGVVLIEGSEEVDIGRAIKLPLGSYRLVAAQRIAGEVAVTVTVDLFFERVLIPLQHSEIIVCDDDLSPSASLIEAAAIAGDQ